MVILFGIREDGKMQAGPVRIGERSGRAIERPAPGKPGCELICM